MRNRFWKASSVQVAHKNAAAVAFHSV